MNVSLLLKGKIVTAFAKAELDEKAVEAQLLDYVQHIPGAARSLGIRMENKIPNVADVRRVAEDKLFVKIKICAT